MAYQVRAQRGSLASDFSNTLSVDLGLGGFTFTSSANPGSGNGLAGSIGGNGGVTAQAA